MAGTHDGRFVWYELLTSDTKAAIAFYGEVLGWKTQPFGGDDYTMWVGSQGPLGGTITLPEQVAKMGVPPHWMSHVQVADVDATVALAQKRGARVHKEASDIPTIGRFAIIADPQGAPLSVFKPAEAMKLHDDKHGEFVWSELVTTDHDAAFAFYAELFGWKKLASHEMGPMGTYLIYGVGDKQLGGMFTKTKEMPMPPSWLYYVHVDDLDGAIARATRGGGKVINGPMEVPTGARIAQLLDPQGAMFALHEAAKAGK